MASRDFSVPGLCPLPATRPPAEIFPARDDEFATLAGEGQNQIAGIIAALDAFALLAGALDPVLIRALDAMEQILADLERRSDDPLGWFDPGQLVGVIPAPGTVHAVIDDAAQAITAPYGSAPPSGVTLPVLVHFPPAAVPGPFRPRPPGAPVPPGAPGPIPPATLVPPAPGGGVTPDTAEQIARRTIDQAGLATRDQVTTLSDQVTSLGDQLTALTDQLGPITDALVNHRDAITALARALSGGGI